MTDPFPATRVDKLKSRQQASIWTISTGKLRVFSAHCCNINSDAIMGIAKTPVVVGQVEPSPVCLGEETTWNFTASYAPGSTISGWEMEFNVSGLDGYESVDTYWSGSDIADASGSFTPLAAGEIPFTFTATEGLGKSKTTEGVLFIVDCPDTVWTYKAMDGDGVFFIRWSDTLPEWDARNTGLEGDALYVRKLIMLPSSKHVQPDYHKLWLASKGGVYYTNNGGKSWFKSVVDDPDSTHSAADLDYLDIVMGSNENTFFTIGLYDNGTEEDLRSWVFKTSNGGIDWSSIELSIES